MRSVGRSLFPIGLYASLLVALLAVMRPGLVAPAERGLSAVAALPFRAYGSVLPQPARAGDEREIGALSRERTHEFWRRVVAAEERHRPQSLGRLLPQACAVRGRTAAGDLVLDVRDREIPRTEPFVTIGDALIGFIVPSRKPEDFVVVRVLSRRERATDTRLRGIPARIESGDVPLRCVVEPAASIDPWPLRIDLIDDPYAAASLQRDGYDVVTTGFADDPLGVIPGGLRIGTLRVWGYERDGRRLPIGFFVEPVPAEGAVLVTLWRHGFTATAEPKSGWRRLPIVAYALTTTGSRWFARVPFDVGALPVDTPIVRGERLIGHVTSAGPGYAFLTPFGGVVGAAFDVVFLTNDGTPHRVTATVAFATTTHIAVRVAGESGLGDRGSLFTTSSRGRPGLFLGDAVRAPNRADTWIVERARDADGAGLTALVDGEGES